MAPELANFKNKRAVCIGPTGTMAEAWLNDEDQLVWNEYYCGKPIGKPKLAAEHPIPKIYDMFGWEAK